jgi:hypothetical protein
MATASKKPWQAGNLRTASKTFDRPNHNPNSILSGGFFAKPSRIGRRPKRGWQRGGRA